MTDDVTIPADELRVLLIAAESWQGIQQLHDVDTDELDTAVVVARYVLAVHDHPGKAPVIRKGIPHVS